MNSEGVLLRQLALIVLALLVSLACEGRSVPTSELAAGGSVARFASRGADLTLPDGARFSLGLVALGREHELHALSDPRPARALDEVRLVRDDDASIVEWWRALEGGLEHGVDLAQPPVGEGLLVFEIATRGLVGHSQSDTSVELADASGIVHARYANLTVIDAAGRRLPAAMRVQGATVRIEVDDRGAQYPIVVDPLVLTQEAVLVPAGAALNDRIGSAVAMSADGSRVVVGASGVSSNRGAAYVFVRSGTAWSLEATLLAPDAMPGDYLGSTVAMSADGALVAVGLPLRGPTGFVRTFTRVGSSWSSGVLITPPVIAGRSPQSFPSGLAISADGSRMATGWIDFSTGNGYELTFARAGASWTPDTPVSAGCNSNVRPGLALDGPGTRLVEACQGASFLRVNIWVISGTVWGSEGFLTIGSDPGASYAPGVAITPDGTRLVAGAPQAGAALVGVRSGATWSVETTLLSPGASGDGFGESAAISDDGAIVFVGAPLATSAGMTQAGLVWSFIRTGGAWGQSASFNATAPVANEFLGRGLAGTGLANRIVAGAPLTSGGAGRALVAHVLGNAGRPCAGSSDCQSGFCVDGVCCTTACGGGSATDCQACSAALTGGTDGTCAALSSVLAPTVICRAVMGACDTGEVCTSASTSCPADFFVGAGTVCRAIAGPCDVAESCTGSAAACPTDSFQTSALTCRPSAGPCDVDDHCSGTAAACPVDVFQPDTLMCRPSIGVCDPLDRCNGTMAACPPDILAPPSQQCRPSGGGCDPAENCDGASVNCPSDRVASAGTMCAAMTNPCDPADVCDGVSRACPFVFAPVGMLCRPPISVCDVAEHCDGTSTCPPDGFMPSTTVCLPSGGDLCDAPDLCTGTSADCMPTFATGVVCRAAAGSCDIAESCSGTAASCPPNGVIATGVTCRMSTDTSCDPGEACDGTSTVCPADISTCVDTGVPHDAGTDAGNDAGGDASARDASAIDASASRDTGTGAPAPAAGCACGASGAGNTGTRLWGIALAVWLVRRRRRTLRHR